VKHTLRQVEHQEPSAQELASVWRRRAADLRHWAAAEGAAVAWECAAKELEAALRCDGGELLTLAEAARESGYTVDHLGRDIARGKIPNAGRLHAPRVRRSDLPKKPGALSPPGRGLHIGRAEIARAVIQRQAGGAR
jgi:hypothetical protein